MTIRDLFTDKTTWSTYGDMDVYNDCIDEDIPCWCGTLLTFEGAEHYDNTYNPYEESLNLLDTPIRIMGEDPYYIMVYIDHYKDYEKRFTAIQRLFSDAAGYCAEYEKWFIDDYDVEVFEKPALTAEGALKFLIDHTPATYIRNTIHEDARMADYLRVIGYNIDALQKGDLPLHPASEQDYTPIEYPEDTFKAMFINALDWIVEHVHEDDLENALCSIGLPKNKIVEIG